MSDAQSAVLVCIAGTGRYVPETILTNTGRDKRVTLIRRI